jgi:xanthine dehydrogenase accessory factor
LGVQDFHQELARLLAQGERVAVATVVRARGSHPRETGAKMLVRADGTTAFTIGGGALEAAVTADCQAALAGAVRGVKSYALTEGGPNTVGMTCGGSVEVFIDVEEPAPRMIVFGAGHVGRALAALAPTLGMALTVVDDRADWLLPERFPAGAALHRCGRDYASDLPDATGAYVAVMTRCHATDVNVVGALAGTAPSYVGVIGSRRKVLRAFGVLEQRGLDRAWLETIHAPIGLDIGAETPGEIALAIAAEIVAVRRGGVEGASSHMKARLEQGATR